MVKCSPAASKKKMAGYRDSSNGKDRTDYEGSGTYDQENQVN